jgi:hypothetical protein
MRGLYALAAIAFITAASLLSAIRLPVEAIKKQRAMLLTQQGKLQEAKDAWPKLAGHDPTDHVVEANLS